MADNPRPTTTTTRQGSESLPTLVTELWELVVAYAKQEALDPIKSLGRFVAFGVAGAVCLSVGAAFVGIGGLRAIQTETDPHLTGDLSWVPYLVLVVFCLVVAGLAVARIGKVPRGQAR